MRGKPGLSFNEFVHQRITPACAGSAPLNVHCSKSTWDPPPRVRGTHERALEIEQQMRITPTCEGNTLYYIALESDGTTKYMHVIQLFAGVDHRRIFRIL